MDEYQHHNFQRFLLSVFETPAFCAIYFCRISCSLPAGKRILPYRICSSSNGTSTSGIPSGWTYTKAAGNGEFTLVHNGDLTGSPYDSVFVGFSSAGYNAGGVVYNNATTWTTTTRDHTGTPTSYAHCLELIQQ